ncbi:hypothetical protein [Sulfobacillus harzensis]|uniref:Uncharacterized protein n=1 Tax=Sulfobacillus harzensis TaxID=2729629 RepID=A0A7Y0L6V4_9FIRM|nr:hypothetical protein [Sulfobacillus harzensis]NMP24398.1 hypothetical protein [Sulfobacillus harzensis]
MTEAISRVDDEEYTLGDAYYDPSFHPEWRIGRVPHDFADLAYLLPAVEAYCCDLREGTVWPEMKMVGPWRWEAKFVDPDLTWTPTATGKFGEALRAAFSCALTESRVGAS